MSANPGSGSDVSTETPTGLPFVAPCRSLSASAPLGWVRSGIRDLLAAPAQSLFYGALLAALGAVLALLTWRLGLLALYVGLASGFVFVGPFLAMGLYSISYQLEHGRAPTLAFSLQEGRAHLRDTLVLGVCLLVVLLVWARAAMIMSVFRPSDAFPTWRDLIPYLSIGTVVGALFSAIIVSTVIAGFATMFIGFVVMIPVIGHATWHAYRETIDACRWPTTHAE